MHSLLRKPGRISFFCLLLLIALSTLAHAEVVSDSRPMIGTIVNIMIWDQGKTDLAKNAIETAYDEIQRINTVFSIYQKESEITRINNAAGKKPVTVSAEVFSMLQKGVKFAQESHGAFDPTFAGAGKLYNFSPKHQIVPTDRAVSNALKNVGIKNLVLDEKMHTAMLKTKGQKLDIGGYIKGYAVDRACEKIRKKGFTDFIVNAGGDMFVSGAKGKKQWRIGIQDPRGKRNDLIAACSIRDKALVTSGDYERFFIKDGARYHHIIDPRTGRPARLCQSVTVISDSSLEADYLATAVFVLGPEKGLELIEKKPAAEAFIIDAKGNWLFSSGFKDVCEFNAVK